MEGNIEYYPLTHPQLGIWYTEKLYPGTSIGIVAGTRKMRGDIDYALLKKAIEIFVERNDTLRLHFVEIDGEPMQYYAEYVPPEIHTFDFSSSDTDELYNWDTDRTRTPFQLIDHDLYEFDILKINDQEAGIYIKLHHLICDGWSCVKTINDMFEIYAELLRDGSCTYEAPSSYSDFIMSEMEYRSSGKFVRDRGYWSGKFSDIPDFTALKAKNCNIRSSSAKRKSFILPDKLSRKIREYCLSNRTSVFTLFLTALSTYINRVTGKDDIVVGVPTLNRSNIAQKSMLGMFINTLPMRISFDPGLNFKVFHNAVLREWMSSLKHHKYPYDLIIGDIREKGGAADDLYDIVLSYQNAKLNRNCNKDEDHEGRWHFCGHQKQSLVIHLNERENDGTLVVNYDYLKNVFHAKEIDFIHDHLIRILWHALDNPGKAVSRLDMISEKEKNSVLFEFNDTLSDYPSEKNIIQIFEEQVRRSPDKYAVFCDNKAITYVDFNRNVNQLAWKLIDAGVEPGDIIAVLIPRSGYALTSIYAILKCGAVFVTIDSSYPKDRIRYILNDAAPKMILVTEDTYHKVSNGCKRINVDDPAISDNHDTDPQIYPGSDSLAYIIYTSGSTGRPKGAMITNKGLVNYIVWADKVYIKGEELTIPLYSSLSFDLTITSMFTPLISGSSISIYCDDDIEQPILKVFRDNSSDIVKLTPSHLSLIKDLDNSDSRIKRLIVGGEDLKTDLAKQVYESFAGHVEIYNEYGPTETVVGCMIYKYDPEKDRRLSVPIGVPADNVKIYILDRYMNPVPIGTPGEMYIGGDGVCAGYLNNPELTSDRFIPDPFNKGERLYKTGDMARWFPRGDAEFLGRKDNQIKIRGHRIEAAEIESQLLEHESISEAVVLDQEHKDGRKYLCAYIVTDTNIEPNDLRLYLTKKLPSYMIPSYFVFINKIPLNRNGKLDRKSLPRPEIKNDSEDFVQPSGETERIIADTVCEVLDMDMVSVSDSFFDMGIDSLDIIRIQTMLLKYDWKISTQDFYEYPNIRLLSEKVGNKSSGSEKDSRYEMRKFKAIHTDGVSRSGNILLTGATGFLGAHLLDSMIKNYDADVFCLIRADNHEKALRKLLDVMNFYFSNDYTDLINSRVYVVCGDLTKPDLGLQNKDLNDLGSKVGRIIHSAALVKHYGDITLFERTNIRGTESLVRVALRYGMQMNHISTISVAGKYRDTDERDYEYFEEDIFAGQTFEGNIYLKSKYKAEEIIVNSIMENGLKANIFRVGNLCGRYSDGVFQRNCDENMFYSRICSIIDAGAISKNIAEFKIDMTPVDYCSDAILRIIDKYSARSDIYHIMNSNSIKLCELIQLLNRIGKSVNIVETSLFLQRIRELCENNTQSRYLQSFVNEINNGFTFRDMVRVNSAKTLDMLRKADFEWPVCSEEYIRKLYGDID